MNEADVHLVTSIATALGVVVAAIALVINAFQLREQARFTRVTHRLHVFANLHENYMKLSLRRAQAIKMGEKARDEVDQMALSP